MSCYSWCYSSSSSRTFHFSHSHNFVNTSLKRDDSVSWSTLDLGKLEGRLHGQTYNLKDLFDYYGYTDDQKIHGAQFVKSPELNKDPIAWICILLDMNFEIPSNMTLECEAHQPYLQVQKFLMPFMFSINNKPDGIIF